MPLDDAIVSTSTPNLFFLDVEPNIPNPADILSSKRYHRLIDAMEERYDYVIFDTPPVGTFVDAAILSTLVDGTILVVRPGHTKRDELTNAYEQLQKADANVLGVCATFCEGTGSEYYSSYYTEPSGQRKGRTEKAAVPTAAPAAPARKSGHAASRATVQSKQASSAPAASASQYSRATYGRQNDARRR